MELFLLMGENYVDNDSLGRMCHTKRKKLEINLNNTNLNWLKRKLYQSFADMGIGMSYKFEDILFDINTYTYGPGGFVFAVGITVLF